MINSQEWCFYAERNTANECAVCNGKGYVPCAATEGVTTCTACFKVKPEEKVYLDTPGIDPMTGLKVGQ